MQGLKRSKEDGHEEEDNEEENSHENEDKSSEEVSLHSSAKRMRCLWDNLNLCKKLIFWTVFGSNNLKSLVMQRSKDCGCAYCCGPDTPWCLPLECKRMKTLQQDCEEAGIRFKIVRVGRSGLDEAGNRLKERDAKEINSVLINVDADIVWCCKRETEDEDYCLATNSELHGRFFFGVTFEDMEANGDVISLKLQTIFVRADHRLGDEGLKGIPEPAKRYYIPHIRPMHCPDTCTFCRHESGGEGGTSS